MAPFTNPFSTHKFCLSIILHPLDKYKVFCNPSASSVVALFAVAQLFLAAFPAAFLKITDEKFCEAVAEAAKISKNYNLAFYGQNQTQRLGR